MSYSRASGLVALALLMSLALAAIACVARLMHRGKATGAALVSTIRSSPEQPSPSPLLGSTSPGAAQPPLAAPDDATSGAQAADLPDPRCITDSPTGHLELHYVSRGCWHFDEDWLVLDWTRSSANASSGTHRMPLEPSEARSIRRRIARAGARPSDGRWAVMVADGPWREAALLWRCADGVTHERSYEASIPPIRPELQREWDAEAGSWPLYEIGTAVVHRVDGYARRHRAVSR